jgi:hypothetical protein
MNHIGREDVPDEIYLMRYSKNSDWDYIYEVDIPNSSLKYYFGSMYDHSNTRDEDIAEMIHTDREIINNAIEDCDKSSNHVSILQEYYYTEYDIFIDIHSVKKIYEYFVNNKTEIDKFIDSYYKEE